MSTLTASATTAESVGLVGLVGLLGTTAPAAIAATTDAVTDWVPWIVLGAIGLLVAGIALRMFIAARFPKGYGAWARSRRDTFAARNADWDNDDERR